MASRNSVGLFFPPQLHGNKHKTHQLNVDVGDLGRFEWGRVLYLMVNEIHKAVIGC